jgi:hypothetical protein
VHWALRWLYSVVPLRYGFRSGVLLEFSGLSFDGFDQCLDSSIPLLKRATMTCWGTKGIDVVEMLANRVFSALTVHDTFLQDMNIILVEIAILKMLYLLVLRWRVR